MTGNKLACITLDLEPDYAGNAPRSYDLWSVHHLQSLIKIFRHHKIPLSVFVVANTLRTYRHEIKILQNYQTEFHLHSYSHNLNTPDSEEEISRGAASFEKFFGYKPVGYRAPKGLISKAGLSALSDRGFLFDASVFPSFWPKASFLNNPRKAYKIDGLKIIEIPFSVISPARFIYSLSWIKLMGWHFYNNLLNIYRLPNPVIFNIHLHDLWTPASYNKLSPLWKFIYSRNRKKGVKYLKCTIRLLKKKGYSFTFISKIADNYSL